MQNIFPERKDLFIEPQDLRRFVPDLVDSAYISKHESFQIGFLSRIHPKKGLDLLIEALSNMEFPYTLLIAGDGEEDYIKTLKEKAGECGNSDNIEWVGWKDGEAKFDFLSRLNLFALTSHSENFAIVVIESLSVGTPVLVSDQIGLNKYIQQNDLGWVCKVDVKSVGEQLNNIYLDKQKLKMIRSLAPGIVRRDYQETNLASQYIQFYEDIKSMKTAEV
jgi:glycosyltransferase involved in cell wall biosynthesis